MSSSNTQATPELPPPPYGWVMEVDPRTQHPYYVDTKANPPRAIWVHPYEDEQYLSENPEIREKIEHAMKKRTSQDDATGGAGPSSRLSADNRRSSLDQRRHSFNGADTSSMSHEYDPRTSSSMSIPASKSQTNVNDKKKRGFFGRMKDKAVGTKEEREAYKKEKARVEEERRKRYAEALRKQQEQYERMYRAQASRRQPTRGSLYNSGYGPPQGNPYYGGSVFAPGNRYGGGGYYDSGLGYGNQYGGGYGSRGGFGGGYGGGYGGGFGGGAGMGLLGGMAGGLLLGDLLGGGF